MADYRATVMMAGDPVEVTIPRDGGLDPPGMLGVLLEYVRDGVRVDLTPTGPTVDLDPDDPFAVLAWIRDTYTIIDEDWPEGWSDPRTEVPADAEA